MAIDDSTFLVGGRTQSRDFPVSSDAYDTTGPSQQNPDYYDGFLASLNWQTGEYHGTYIGGNAHDRIAKNTFKPASETITVLGWTSSTDFPVTDDAFQLELAGALDGFVVKFSRDLTQLLYSTYIGGSAEDQFNVAYLENDDSLWIVGKTLSIDFPTTPDALQPSDNGLTSGFVLHFAIDTTADTTNAVEHTPLPTEFAFSAFPNPFNPTTMLSFDLPHAIDVKIHIHDILGREVKRLDLGALTIGHHDIAIGSNDWPSGFYFASISTETFSQTTKLLLLK